MRFYEVWPYVNLVYVSPIPPKSFVHFGIYIFCWHYLFKLRYLIFYMRKVVGVGVAFKDKHGRILLHHRDNNPGTRNPGKFALFGGGVDPMESLFETAFREVREELNFEMNPEFLNFIVALNGESYESYIYEYSQPVSLDDLQLGKEGSGLGFFSRKEIASMDDCLPYVKELFPYN